MKDMGEVRLFLGMQVRRGMREGWLELGQFRYVSSWEKKYEGVLCESSGHCSTPMDVEEAKVLRKIFGEEKE